MSRFSVYVDFRGGRLTMKRGITSLEDAVAFAGNAANLRFRNHDRIFVVDDEGERIVWRAGGAPPPATAELAPNPSAQRRRARASAKAPRTFPVPETATETQSKEPSPQAAIQQYERLTRALHAAQKACERGVRTLVDGSASLEMPASADLAESAERLHQERLIALRSFEESLSTLEAHLQELRRK